MSLSVGRRKSQDLFLFGPTWARFLNAALEEIAYQLGLTPMFARQRP